MAENELDPKVLEKLNVITQKEIAALTDADIVFLRARSSYLNPVQKQVYAPVLKGEFTPEPPPKVDRNEQILPTGEHPSYRDLQLRAKELGLKHIRIKRDALVEYIKTHEPQQ